MSQSQFLNRQALHLRPDPARVVVRPFRPAIEPRDLNPFDRSKANHIVDRVLRLEPEAAVATTGRRAGELRRPPPEPDRHFRDARRRDGGGLRAARGIEPDAAPADRRLFSERVFVRGVGPVQSEHRAPSRSDRRAGKWLPIHPEPSRRRRRPYLVADVPLRQHRGGRQRHRRSDRASRIGPQGSQSERPGRMARRSKWSSARTTS